MAQPNSPVNTQDAGRDPRLSSFASGGLMDGAEPDSRMAAALEAVTGASGRPPAAASDDEVVGMTGCWQALEAHAYARMLAAVREIIRRRAAGGGVRVACAGDLPRRWDIGVAHEVAAGLRISWQAAVPVVQLAWELGARLPGAGALLDAGVLTSLKVKIIAEEFTVLDDAKIAEAEKLLLEQDLAGDEMTPGRLRKLCQTIADTVDPQGARERRESAARDRARVAFYRAHGGGTVMFAEGLPPDEALKAQGNIQARAVDYKKAMVYPEAGMDLLRVLAMVDLINGLTLDGRLAEYRTRHAAAEDARNAAQRAADQETVESLARFLPDPPAPGTGPTGSGGEDGRSGEKDDGNGSEDPSRGSGGPEYGWPDDEDDPETARYGDDPDKPEPPLPDEEPGDLDDDCQFWPGFGPGPGGAPEPDRLREPGGSCGPDASSPFGPGEDGGGRDDCDTQDPGDDGSGGGDRGGGGARRGGPGPGRPGGTPGGARDPGLPALTHLTLPLATLLGLAETPGEAPGYGSVDPGLARDLAVAAAASPRTRYCLTITDEHGHATGHACARLIRETGDTGRSGQAGGSRDGPGGWGLTPQVSRPGPGGGYGTWILTVPGGSRYRLDLYPVPVHDCDHRHASGSYRPGTLLRHLVEVRDGECTFPGCSHPATRCDFEHAIPYDKGGVTDACNAGARSRRCHQVKQSRGWTVTQPEPGTHQWRTPSGRSYTKGPKRYL